MLLAKQYKNSNKNMILTKYREKGNNKIHESIN